MKEDRLCGVCGNPLPKKREFYCSKHCSNVAKRKGGYVAGDTFWGEDEDDSLKRIRKLFWLDERKPATYVAKTMAECEALNKANGKV